MVLNTVQKLVKYKFKIIRITGIILLSVVSFIGGRIIQNILDSKQEFASPELTKVIPEVTPTLNPSPTTNPFNSTVKENQEIIVDEPQWVHLASSIVGVSFEYPIPEKGKISFVYSDSGDRDTDPSGQSYRWSYEIFFDSPSPVPYTKPQAFKFSEKVEIAGGISSTFKAGRDRAIVDFYQLGNSTHEEAIKVFRTKYGTEAVLSARPMIEIDEQGKTYSDPNDKATIIEINLPFKYNPKFKGIVIYSKSGFSIDEAQRIVSSLTVK